MHPNAERVQRALRKGGSESVIVELADPATTAALAAEALGVQIGQIANSLVFLADGKPVLILTSGASTLPVLIDRDLERYDAIWAAAGTPHTVFRSTYAELAPLSGARPADVRRD